jgi:hypothetical protein
MKQFIALTEAEILAKENKCIYSIIASFVLIVAMVLLKAPILLTTFAMAWLAVFVVSAKFVELDELSKLKSENTQS